MHKALFTTILMLNSFFLVAQEPKLSEIIQAKKKVGDYLFKTGSSLDGLKLDRQQEQHNKTPLDWGGNRRISRTSQRSRTTEKFSTGTKERTECIFNSNGRKNRGEVVSL
jgi:hypothetical protein